MGERAAGKQRWLNHIDPQHEPRPSPTPPPEPLHSDSHSDTPVFGTTSTTHCQHPLPPPLATTHCHYPGPNGGSRTTVRRRRRRRARQSYVGLTDAQQVHHLRQQQRRFARMHAHLETIITRIRAWEGPRLDHTARPRT